MIVFPIIHSLVYSTNSCVSAVSGTMPSTKNKIVSLFPNKKRSSTLFGSTYTKIETVPRRLAWPLHKDDIQIDEEYHIFLKKEISPSSPHCIEPSVGPCTVH